MQNEDKSAMASNAKNPLSDDEIIEFAETVLADLDDSALEAGEDMALVEDDDDIIDLTEVADKPEGNDDILELTEDIHMDPSTEEDILELKDIDENGEDQDEEAFELEDDFENLIIEDDVVSDVNDAIDDLADLPNEDTNAREVITEPYDFAGDDETLDLSSVDLDDMSLPDPEDEDGEFDFETDTENLNANADESLLRVDGGEEETDSESEDQVSEESPADADPMTVDLEMKPLEDQIEDLIGGRIGNQIENQITDGQQAKLELTEADRRFLEEELSLDIDDGPSTATSDGLDSAATADGSPDEAIDPGRFQSSESGEPSDAENVLPSTTAEVSQPDFAKAPSEGMSEAFDFDFDETTEDNPMAENDPPMSPTAGDEELSVESLLADGDAAGNAEQYQSFDEALDGIDRNPAADETEPEEPSETGYEKERQTAAAPQTTSDPFESPDPQGGLTSSDLMATPVIGLAARRPADDDRPTDSLHAPLPEILSGSQLEEVVEQAVKKLFGEKIETMLHDAIEKAVTKEIDRLKTLILGDIDHDR